MNLTLSLLTGLVLLLPGTVALVAWNLRGNRYGVRRPDLPLTAVSALVAAITTSIVAHGLGFLLGELAVALTRELDLPVLAQAPYRTMITLGLEGKVARAEFGFVEFLAMILALSLAAFIVVSSPVLDLVLQDVDAWGQGWAFKHVVQPHMREYTPIAFVMTNLEREGVGVGYQGPIAELKQAEDGSVKTIVLGQPERFLYEVKAGKPAERFPDRAAELPSLQIHTRQWVGGAVVLDGASIRNIVIRNVPEDELGHDASEGADE